MDTKQARVLVLDDEPELRALLQRYLTEQGFTVRTVAEGRQLDRLLQREPFDLLVLDVMLPGEDGLAICSRLRALGETIPIIMLTARGDPVDRIVGREAGADDYLAKPFDPRELLACIHAQLRRQRMLGRHQPGGNAPPVKFGPYLFDPARRRLLRGEEAIALTSGELDLLAVLAMHAGRPLSRTRLVTLLRGGKGDVTDRSVDVQVMRLRRIIEPDPAQPRYLQTVRSVGYVLIADPHDP